MEYLEFAEICTDFFQSKQLNGRAENLSTAFHFEPCTRITGAQRSDFFDGLQLNYFLNEGIFEVSEYQAGPGANELHIYKETTSLKIALKELLKGNKRKPLKVWN